MKKLNVFVILLLVVPSSVPVLAEDAVPVLISAENVQIDAETKEQIQLMKYQEGAEVRLLQLQEAIAKKIEEAESVIAEISAKDADAEVSELEAFVAELKLVDEQAIALDPSSETAVTDFVAVKKASIELIQEFKMAAKVHFTNEEAEQLRERVKAEKSEKVEKLQSRVKEAKNKYNSERSKEMLKNMGSSNSEIAEKVKKGEMTAEQVKTQLKEEYRNLTDSEKTQAKEKIAVHKRDNQAKNETVLEKVQAKLLERNEEMLQNRLQKAENMVNSEQGKMIQSRITQKIEASNERIAQMGEGPVEDSNKKGGAQE